MIRFLILTLLLMNTAAWCGAEGYVFDIAWDQALPGEVRMDGAFPGVPPRGPLHVENGKIVDRQGQPVRLWGAGLRITRAFLSADARDKEAVLDKLSQLGFNHLRIIGLDFDDPGMFKHWMRRGVLPIKEMAEFCQFIELARRKGFLYSLEINHVASKFRYVSGALRNRRKERIKHYKTTQLYDPKILNTTKRWFDALMGNKHPGCSYRLADDPSVSYLSLVNEDSIFNSYYRGFKDLTRDAIRELERKYSDYLASSNTKQRSPFASVQTRTGIDGDKGKGGGARLCRYGQKGRCTKAERILTLEFLMAVERSYFRALKEELRTMGYKGLISTTNNWYGYPNLMTNAAVGDVIDMHIYMDPPRKASYGGLKWETVRNKSFIASPFYDSEPTDQLYRLYAAAVKGKPMIISEWNTGFWSDYHYQGAVMLPVFAARQGVQVMDLHTTFPRREGYKADYSTSGLSIWGNPTLIALLPSLSAAFREGLVGEWSGVERIVSASNREEYLMRSEEVGKRPLNMNRKVPVQLGFVKKLEKQLIGLPPYREPMGGAQIQQVLARGVEGITWDRWNSGKGRFVIQTEKFAALLGGGAPVSGEFGNIRLETDDPAALLLLSLDGRSLARSKKLLLTVVSNFRNSQEKLLDVRLGRFGGRLIRQPGRGRPRLKRVRAKVGPANQGGRWFTVSAVMPSGNKKPMVSDGKEQGDSDYVVGNDDTPWYLIEYK